jgi:hypothetical protein
MDGQVQTPKGRFSGDPGRSNVNHGQNSAGERKKLSEFKRETRVATVVAVAVAVGVGLLAIFELPSSGCPNPGPSPGGKVPVALSGLMTAEGVSCTYSTGVCDFNLVNNSTVPVALVACQFQVVLSRNGTQTTYGNIQGSVAGPATSKVPGGSKVMGTCTMPSSRLSLETNQTAVSGLFTVKLLENWNCVTAGNEPSFGFVGTWN